MTEARQRQVVNKYLAQMGKRYTRYLPIQEIDQILEATGFSATEPAIYCGREGRSHEQVGPKTWLHMSWYKMPSGNYETVAYVS